MIPELASIATLASLDRMTAGRLRSLLADGDPVATVAAILGEAPASPALAALLRRDPTLGELWRRDVVRCSPERMGPWCDELGVDVVVPGDARFPHVLLDDPQRPAALFVQGDTAALEARRVGVVGTRNPTRQGLQTAARLGHELAGSGVAVVSGLAKGIDGAAHRGALAADPGARPIAVVANGHDAPYPRRHADLWNEVAASGLVVSEWPPGTLPEAYRFPQRNRILAALSEVLVVVESRERGGSLITAQLAAERGVDVFAVPGSIASRASAGTNRLLRDGAAVATDVEDVLAALGLDTRRAGNARHDPRARPRGVEAEVLALCVEAPRDVEGVAGALGTGLAEAAMALARLERSGWVAETAGWFEALDEWASLS